MYKDKFVPLWEHKRYSLGYFKEGFWQIKAYWEIRSIIGIKEMILAILDTVLAMILGKALLYK